MSELPIIGHGRQVIGEVLGIRFVCDPSMPSDRALLVSSVPDDETFSRERLQNETLAEFMVRTKRVIGLRFD